MLYWVVYALHLSSKQKKSFKDKLNTINAHTCLLFEFSVKNHFKYDKKVPFKKYASHYEIYHMSLIILLCTYYTSTYTYGFYQFYMNNDFVGLTFKILIIWVVIECVQHKLKVMRLTFCIWIWKKVRYIFFYDKIYFFRKQISKKIFWGIFVILYDKGVLRGVVWQKICISFWLLSNCTDKFMDIIFHTSHMLLYILWWNYATKILSACDA